MFYKLIKTPVIVKTGYAIIDRLDSLLADAHIIYPQKILITQPNLYESYRNILDNNKFHRILFVRGGNIEESSEIIEKCKDEDALIMAFGGGSILDIVKYSASRMDKPYITIPSTLSNDAIYSCVARLTSNGKKMSYGVTPPIGIIVDLIVIRNSPKNLIMAGVADLVSNLSAIQDWVLAHNDIGEPINELAYMLAKEAAMPILQYDESDITSDKFLLDLTNGLITSGLSMIVSGNTRGTSGAEHLISHAIDEYFPDKSTVHGLQVGWAHKIIEKRFHQDNMVINKFFDRIGLSEIIKVNIPFRDEDFDMIVPYARKIRNRYTILNTI